MENIKGLSGFTIDEELIGYCEEHCETPRALFHKNQIAKMLELAGEPEGHSSSKEFYEADVEWQSVHEPMKELVKLARARLKN